MFATPTGGDLDVPLIPGVSLEPKGAREMTELEPGGALSESCFVRRAGERNLGGEASLEPSRELPTHLRGIEPEPPRSGEIGRGAHREIRF